MKKFAISCALVALLGGSLGLAAPSYAQGPPPPPAAGENSHAKLEAAVQQLDLKPRQKIQILKIIKQAKANGQDKKVTAEQVSEVLDPAQKKKLVELMVEAKAQK